MIHVHFHTDCYSCSGSETTLLHLLTTMVGNNGVRTSFTYRPSAEYDEGLRRLLPAGIQSSPTRLPDPASIAHALTRRLPRWAARPLRVALLTLGLRQACLVIDLAVMVGVLRRERPDVLQVNNGGLPGAQSCTAAALAAWVLGVPTVYEVHNLALGYRNPTRWLDWPIDQLLARAVDVFVTGSAAAGARLRRVLRRDHGFEVITNAVEPHAPRRSSAEVRASLGVGPDVPLLLQVARLEERKGHVYLLEALNLLRSDRGKAAVLVIAGDGPRQAVLESSIRELGLRERVRLIGLDPDPWSLYAAADVVVLPSIANEDLPITIFEAMACARPVVATPIAGIPEQVDDGLTGMLVEPRNPGALADAIDTLLKEPNRAAAMGEAGRQRFHRFFSPRVTEERFLELWERLAGPRELTTWQVSA